MSMWVLTIYTNRPVENLAHKHLTSKLDHGGEGPATKCIGNSLTDSRKFHRLKREPNFSNVFQMEWREPFDFQTGIPGFPM